MPNSGYVRVYRQIKNTAIWADSDKLKLWLLCLIKVAYEDQTMIFGNQTIQLSPGQFVTGRDSLESEFNVDVSKDKMVSGKTLYRWLDLFEKLEMLDIKKSNKYSVITVLNWDKYQCGVQQVSNKCPTSVPQVSNKCPTSVHIQEVFKNTNKSNKSKKKTYGLIVDDYTKDENLKKALLDFVEMRKAMKGFTERALNLNLKTLDKLSGETDIKTQIVNQCVENSWKSFYPLKKNNQQTKINKIPDWMVQEDQTDQPSVDEDELKKLMESLE